MKRKNNGGFAMVEVLVAIAILAGIVVPVLSSLMLSLRMNAKAENILQARIAVSSAVETLIAEGITGEDEDYAKDRFPGVTIKTSAEILSEPSASIEEGAEEETQPQILIYKVQVSDDAGVVDVTTYIRAAEEGTE